MPKIIQNLDEKILNKALELFAKEGYEKVDMRAIARELGIAVGTLYNYYPNKKNLFLKSFEKSWKGTFDNLDKIMDLNQSFEEKIYMFLDEIYDGVIKRKGIGIQFLIYELQNNIGKNDKRKSSNPNISEICKVTKTLKDKMELLIVGAKTEKGLKLEKEKDGRMASSLISLTFNILIEYPNEKSENLCFLNNLVRRFLQK